MKTKHLNPKEVIETHIRGAKLKIGTTVRYDRKKDNAINFSLFIAFLENEYRIIILFGREFFSDILIYEIVGIK